MSDGHYEIEADNIYEAADPRDGGRRILVTSFYTGYQKAQIVSYPSLKNNRQVDTKYLHEDRNTGQGTPRRNGYFFVGKKQDIEAQADATA